MEKYIISDFITTKFQYMNALVSGFHIILNRRRTLNPNTTPDKKIIFNINPIRVDNVSRIERANLVSQFKKDVKRYDWIKLTSEPSKKNEGRLTSSFDINFDLIKDVIKWQVL